MIVHIWSVMCEKSIIDKDSNNISLYNVLEQVNVTPTAERPEGTLGIIPISYEVVTLWMREDLDVPARVTARMELTSQFGDTWPTNEFEVDLSEYVRARTILRSNALPYNKQGIYYFNIDIKKNDDWENVAKVPLQIAFK